MATKLIALNSNYFLSPKLRSLAGKFEGRSLCEKEFGGIPRSGQFDRQTSS